LAKQAIVNLFIRVYFLSFSGFFLADSGRLSTLLRILQPFSPFKCLDGTNISGDILSGFNEEKLLEELQSIADSLIDYSISHLDSSFLQEKYVVSLVTIGQTSHSKTKILFE